MIPSAFWIPESEQVFHPTISTQGPWNPQFQHGGPPAGLLVRQMELCSPRADMVLARVSIDILGPIPLVALRAVARVVRPGRKVEMLEASLEYKGRPVMRATGWRIQVPSIRPEISEADPSEAENISPIPDQETDVTADAEWHCGFLAATEWRYVHGGYTSPGDATAWTRLRHPLIEGEEVTPAQRLLILADSANGISSPLDIRSWQFVPPELTVHCIRPPVGEWICLDARTQLQTEGVGLTSASLYDTRGLVGRSAQALFISQQEKRNM